MSRRRIWILLVLVAVAAAVIVALAGRGGDAAPAWRTEAVTRGAVRTQVSATGTLSAVTTVQVGSQVSGTIAALYADFNGVVKRGQVLAQLDPTFLRAQVAQNRAELQRAEVQLRQALRDSARVAPLGAQGLASQADLDATQTSLDAARASVAAARATMERAETNLRYATIVSPIDGVVISRDVDEGQTVAASLQAPTLFTIANDLTQMQLETAVDEADIGSIKAGQAASFTVDSYPEMSFRGTVHQVRLQPETIQNVVTYTVVILVENPDLRLLPGMTANVTILVDSVEGVLKVPAGALRFRPPGAAAPGDAGPPRSAPAPAGERREGGPRPTPGSESGGPLAGGGRGRVFVLDGGEPRPVRVRTGLSDGTFTAVFADSLREGDLVIVGTASSTNGAAPASGQVNPFGPRMPTGRSGSSSGGRR